MKRFFLIASSALLAGCLPMGNFEITETNSEQSFSVPTVLAGNCGADGLQNLMGSNESELSSVTLPEGTRLIRPGSAYTQDADRSRLNIGIAANGTIVHVACG